MEVLTLAFLAATIAVLHRFATSPDARSLMPGLEDPLAVSLARLGFRADDHQEVRIAGTAHAVLPLSFAGTVRGHRFIVRRHFEGQQREIELSVVTRAWPNASVVVSEILEVDSMLAAALLGGGMAEHIEHGATLSLDDGVLRLSQPATFLHSRATPSAVEALANAASRLQRGPEHLPDWVCEVATSDTSPFARRCAVATILADHDDDVRKAKVIEEGERDVDVGVRLAVAEHVGDDVVGFLELLACSKEEPRRVRRDAIEQLFHHAPVERTRSAVAKALGADDDRRDDALSTLTELASEDELAPCILELVDDRTTLALARPVLWALIVAADEPVALEAVERLGHVGTGTDVQDLRRIEASHALVAKADEAACRIRERVGIHGLSIVEPSEVGALSVAADYGS